MDFHKGSSNAAFLQSMDTGSGVSDLLSWTILAQFPAWSFRGMNFVYDLARLRRCIGTTQAYILTKPSTKNFVLYGVHNGGRDGLLCTEDTVMRKGEVLEAFALQFFALWKRVVHDDRCVVQVFVMSGVRSFLSRHPG